MAAWRGCRHWRTGNRESHGASQTRARARNSTAMHRYAPGGWFILIIKRFTSSIFIGSPNCLRESVMFSKFIKILCCIFNITVIYCLLCSMCYYYYCGCKSATMHYSDRKIFTTHDRPLWLRDTIGAIKKMTETYDVEIQRSEAMTSPKLPVDLAYLIASFPTTVCQFPIRSTSPMTMAFSLTVRDITLDARTRARNCRRVISRDVSRPVL